MHNDESTCYSDGRIYDDVASQYCEDLPFYAEQIEKFGQPVLELACGTGRLTIPLAKRGYEIWGLDLSQPLLDHARHKADVELVKVKFFHSDCRNFDLNQQFAVIFLAFNALAHLPDRESVEACLNCVKKHLKSDGRFILSYFNPLLNYLTRDPQDRFTVTEYVDETTNAPYILTESNVYDRATQINHVTWFRRNKTTGRETTETLTMRIFFPQELEALLYYNGFEIEDKYGDESGSSFEKDSRLQICVCNARK